MGSVSLPSIAQQAPSSANDSVLKTRWEVIEEDTSLHTQAHMYMLISYNIHASACLHTYTHKHRHNGLYTDLSIHTDLFSSIPSSIGLSGLSTR